MREFPELRATGRWVAASAAVLWIAAGLGGCNLFRPTVGPASGGGSGDATDSKGGPSDGTTGDSVDDEGDGGGSECVDAESTCWDGKDNDCDGDTDCDDADCQGRSCGKVEGNHTRARCRSIAGKMECREVACCNCDDDDGDGINDFGVAVGKETPIRERECQSVENPGCDVRTKCSNCTFDPSEEKNVDSDDSHRDGVCTGQPTHADGSCFEPKGFEKVEKSSDDGKDNDCDGLIDEESNDSAGNRCETNQECGTGLCREGVCVHQIFVTSSEYGGAFDDPGRSGAARADTICSKHADDVPGSSTWKAVLAAGGKGPMSRIDIAAPIYLVSGGGTSGPTRVSGLRRPFSGELEHPIDRTENGSVLNEKDEVWTGVTSKGGSIEIGENCQNWSVDGTMHVGGVGDPTEKTEQWLHDDVRDCSYVLHLYCINGQ